MHPCIIDGARVLVYEKGLKSKDPNSYSQLKQFAQENKFELKEDARSSAKKIKFERRMAKTIPMLFLASGIFMQGTANADNMGLKSGQVVEQMPEVEVTAKRDRSQRAFKIKNGKRFVTDPYGEVESIFKVASETKRLGNLKRISTRGITMP